MIHKCELFWGIGCLTCFQSQKDVTLGGEKWGLVSGFWLGCSIVSVFCLFVWVFFYLSQMLCSLFRAALEKQALLGVGDPLQREILDFMSLAV